MAVRCEKNMIDTGGEGGIRTPGTSFSSYNGLANRRLQPLGHLTAALPAALPPTFQEYSTKDCSRSGK